MAFQRDYVLAHEAYENTLSAASSASTEVPGKRPKYPKVRPPVMKQLFSSDTTRAVVRAPLKGANCLVRSAGSAWHRCRARATTTPRSSSFPALAAGPRPEEHVGLRRFREGVVFLWPKEAQKDNLPPLRVRLLRIRADKKRDVWLLTNVLDAQRLTVSMAARYYRWRWENEGLFRTFKHTLAKVRLMSRTVCEIHREAEGALLATQLLLAQGEYGVRAGSSPSAGRCSPRKVLLVMRDVIVGKIGIRKKRVFQKRLAKALREDRQRTSSKVSRAWPRRVKHKPPKPPRFLMLTHEQKELAHQLLGKTA